MFGPSLWQLCHRFSAGPYRPIAAPAPMKQNHSPKNRNLSAPPRVGRAARYGMTRTQPQAAQCSFTNENNRKENTMGLFSKDIKTMDDLFVHTLRDIYYAEKQIAKNLPKMIDKASNSE